LNPLPTVPYLFLSLFFATSWLTKARTRVCDPLVIGSLEDLIRHGLHALRETLQQDKELTTNNTSIGILGPGSVYEAADTPVDFRILEGPPIEVYLQTMQPKEVPPPASTSATASGSAQPPPGGDDDVQMSEQ
jgi:20S proteasome subunit alpha 6